MIETILEPGIDAGFSTVEAFGEKNERQEYQDLGDGRVLHHALDTHRVSVRAFWDLGDPVGFQLSSPGEASLKDAFSRIYATRLPDPKENWAGNLPAAVKKVRVDIFDEGFDSIKKETFIAMREKVLGILARFPGLQLNKLHLAKVFRRVYLANTLGLNAKYRQTQYYLGLSLGQKDNLVDLLENRIYFDQLDPADMVDQARFLLNSLTGNRPRFKGNTYLILSPAASAFILREFSDNLSLNGEKRKVDFNFPAILNVIDDPLLDRQVGSVPFDDEGVQGGGTFLVRKGALREWISNVQTAFLQDASSSGNGFRNGKSVFPGIRFSNLYIQPTVLPLKNLLKDAGTGILVTLIKLKRVDPERHLFSAYGYRFRGNEYLEPVHIYFQTSFISYFLNVIKVSRELQFFNTSFNVGSPYILLEAKKKNPDLLEI